MMIRVIRQPEGSVNGVSLAYYKVGRCYDVKPLLAEFLVLNGYAMIEMRRDERAPRLDQDRPRKGHR